MLVSENNSLSWSSGFTLDMNNSLLNENVFFFLFKLARTTLFDLI